MSHSISEIQVAIDSSNIEHARELLREALKQNPSADIYYLAAQVAVNEGQKKVFLEKAVAVDPFHEKAIVEIHQMEKISVQEPIQQKQQKIDLPPVTISLTENVKSDSSHLEMDSILTSNSIENPDIHLPFSDSSQEIHPKESIDDNAEVKPLPPVIEASSPKLSNQKIILAIVGLVLLGILGNYFLNNIGKSSYSPPVVYSRPSYTATPSIKYYSLSISQRTTLSALLHTGDQVSVTATGKIRVSPVLGSYASPDGVDDGAELLLSSYSITNDFKHGALLCALTTEEYWHKCGSSYSFTVSGGEGYLEFNINDDGQGNNSGEFSVNIKVISK